MAELRAPFPWFGGKSRVAAEVWRRFGVPASYVEPFCGSAAVLLARPDPDPSHVETINDADGLLTNFWRALVAAPEVVAHYADWPQHEADLHARHLWLCAHRPRITEALMGDPHWYDPRAAGWWVWGIGCWIGSGWCSGRGPWHSVDGLFRKGDPGRGVHRQSLHLGDPGRGVHRKSLHLGDPGRGVHRKSLHLGNPGLGVHRQSLHLGNTGRGGMHGYLLALAERMRHVRVNCGDWSRVVGPSVLRPRRGCAAAVFLDPPYAAEHDAGYSVDTAPAPAVRAWAIEHGAADPDLRIAYCSYDDETMPDGWTAYRWRAAGGYSGQAAGPSRGKSNRGRETVWFSPACEAST